MMGEGAITGQASFQAALRDSVIKACAEGCREMFWLSERFVDWPLSDPELLAALSAWARPPRRLHLLALEFDSLRVRHPRFVRWRGTYGNCVAARAIDDELAPSLASGGLAALMLAPPLSLRLFDAQSGRAVLSRAPIDGLRSREKFDAMAQRSCESFAVTTLGL